MEVGAEKNDFIWMYALSTLPKLTAPSIKPFWTVRVHFDVSLSIISVIRQFHNGMQAYVRLDDRVYSG